MDVVREGEKEQKKFVLTVSENGYGKKTLLSEYPIQGRGGKGVIAMRIGEKTGKVTEGGIISPEDTDLFLISASGQVIRVDPREISKVGRATQGVRVMRLSAGDKLASIASSE